MFTGIIKQQSVFKIEKQTSTDLVISTNINNLGDNPGLGESIAINGVCLTISKIEKGLAFFDLMDETLKKTTFKFFKTKTNLNIEDSIKVGDKLGGHLVYGDVDDVGRIIKIKVIGNSTVYRIKYDPQFAKYIIDKGRITLDGASLTIINSSLDGIFEISLIPHSLKILNISKKNIGDFVNLEFDVYAKLVYKQKKYYA